MEASRVVISRETRQQLANNPLFTSRKAKSRFRAQRIIDYVNSKPSGATFGISELLSVAGYTDSQYATGWAFVRRLEKSGILWIEKNNKFKKQVVVCKNADGSKLSTVKQVKEPRTEETVSPEVIEEKAKRAEIAMIDERKAIFREEVKTLAKEFAWSNNSDSLREFVNSL